MTRPQTATIPALLICALLAGCGDKPAPQEATVATNNTTATNLVTAAPKETETNREASGPKLEEVPVSAPTEVTNTRSRPVTVPATKSIVAASEINPDTEKAVLVDAQGRPLPEPALVDRANSGDKQAQRELGEFYGKQWRFEESNEWYRKAAEQGDAKAQHIMGVRYTFGQGVEKDTQEAGKWFLLAAEQGHAGAQYSIGVRWTRGEAGEPRDLVEAAKWFRLAAEQGHGEGQLSLGRRYANGEGVDQDFIEAYKWMWLAKNHSDSSDAAQELKKLAVQMTPEQIAQAKLMAQGFTPKPPTPLNRQR